VASRFKVEHFSAVPPGYKVRTVVRKAHRVRIAYPPGRRVKGSGKVVEVLHPVNENSCRLSNPMELVVLANPGKTESATRVCEDFHGRSCDAIETFHEPSPRALTLGELAQLVELRVQRDSGWKWASLDFSGRGVKMGSNPAGTQIYFVQGNQKISRGELTRIGVDNSKEMIDLGSCRYIAYRSDKPMTDGIPAEFEHPFGEETKEFPRLMYDNRGPEPRLFLTGGAYRVEGLWIRN
jgi:hypothetical protein